MSFVGFTADIRKPEGLETYLTEIDLCAEYIDQRIAAARTLLVPIFDKNAAVAGRAQQ